MSKLSSKSVGCMCMQVLSESTQWFFGGQTIHKEWIIATFYVNVDEELEQSFWAPIKPSSLQPHTTTTSRLYGCWVHHESWKSTGEVSSIGMVFDWKRCRHICPMCWFLHSIALDIEPSPNPLFCNVKFNPIEDQSTVLFRIIKNFTTKSVNLRFLLVSFTEEY